MHVGHGRGAVFGDALANLLAFAGYNVTREYYVNDAGAQVDVLARSAFLRYREALGENIGAIPDGLYPGDYLKAVGEALAQEHGKALLEQARERMAAARARGRHRRDDGDHHATISRRSASSTSIFFRTLAFGRQGRGRRRRIEALRARPGMSTRAACRRRRAAPRGLGGPRADAVPLHRIRRRRRPAAQEIRRRLYLFCRRHRLSPIDKIERGFKTLIDVWGADHGGYVKRMQAAVAALSGGKVDLDVKLMPARASVARRRAGEDVETGRGLRHLARSRRRGRAGPGPLHDAVSQERRGARFRPRQGDRAVARKSGLLRPVRPCPRLLSVSEGEGSYPRNSDRSRRLRESATSRYSPTPANFRL